MSVLSSAGLVGVSGLNAVRIVNAARTARRHRTRANKRFLSLSRSHYVPLPTPKRAQPTRGCLVN
jgi:hypothetical protein